MLLALLLAAAPSPLFADPDLAEAMGRIDPRPGAWVEYLVRAPGRDDLRVRATVLPAATGGRHWIELITASADGIVSASRLLLRADSLFPRNVERMYLMLAGQQPIEVPMDRIKLPEARIHTRGASGCRLERSRRRRCASRGRACGARQPCPSGAW